MFQGQNPIGQENLESEMEWVAEQRRERIADYEARHRNYSDPPRRVKRWWQFWKRDENKSEQ